MYNNNYNYLFLIFVGGLWTVEILVCKVVKYEEKFKTNISDNLCSRFLVISFQNVSFGVTRKVKPITTKYYLCSRFPVHGHIRRDIASLSGNADIVGAEEAVSRRRKPEFVAIGVPIAR